MKNMQKIYAFLGIIILVLGIYVWNLSIKPKPFELRKPEKNDELSERNIVKIRVDSLTKIIDLVYEDDATVSMADDDRFQVKLRNQGNSITNFYNDNPRLLETDDDRFSIKHEKNIVEASFKIETAGQIKYAFVPTDVVYKLSELAYNK
ncbi:hypothetical protein GCM10011514_45020 [Emticicia aquatilis]|uniref:Uncharacterized protein n=2 Tax=Emticicia aquatilis TaxID=1537369 RepID=A0A916Z5T9_9BACT|nr:hypothetical protein GCM10011514_45020 [Emticicia aquatilis]